MRQRGGPPRMRFQLKDSTVLAISGGDLTRWEGDAIVNAANMKMLGGGGVDGAIHRAAGPQLLDACYNVELVAPHVRCPTGEARITPGFRLKAKHVIHTVGPIYESHEESAPLLRDSIKNSLELCREKGLKTVAFPAISCGIYGYPPDEAARVAVETMVEYSEGIDLIEFVLFGPDTYNPFVAQASEMLELLTDYSDNAADAAAAGDSKGQSKAEDEASQGKGEASCKAAEGNQPQQETTEDGESATPAEEGGDDAMDIAMTQETTADAEEGTPPKSKETSSNSAEKAFSPEAVESTSTADVTLESEDSKVEPMSQEETLGAADECGGCPHFGVLVADAAEEETDRAESKETVAGDKDSDLLGRKRAAPPSDGTHPGEGSQAAVAKGGGTETSQPAAQAQVAGEGQADKAGVESGERASPSQDDVATATSAR